MNPINIVKSLFVVNQSNKNEGVKDGHHYKPDDISI
jgi:hypothetical protein